MFGQPAGAIMQVAFTVPDLLVAVEQWAQVLAIGPFFALEHFHLDEFRYRGRPCKADFSLAIAFSGSMSFELIQQHDASPSVYRELIERRGYGFHHVALATIDFDAELTRLTAGGSAVAMSGVVPVGAGSRLAYVDTCDLIGGMTELIEVNAAVEGLFTQLRDAAATWDGKEALRRM